MKSKHLLLALVLGAGLLFVGGLSAATQYCASSFRYHPVLGRPVIVLGTPCYAPWALMGWEQRFQKRAPRVFCRRRGDHLRGRAGVTHAGLGRSRADTGCSHVRPPDLSTICRPTRSAATGRQIPATK